jgi:hypothetical protein
MDDFDEVQTQLIDCFYLLTIGIGRTKNRLLSITKDLGLLSDEVPPLSHSSYGAQ